MTLKRLILSVIALAVIVFGLIVTGIWGPSGHNPAPAQQVQTTQTPQGMSRGEYVAKMSDCTACHTTEKDKPFAGGLGMPLPIGTLYSTNITPDKETGIGNYSLDDFKRVLREGVRKDGGHLYPAMPYTEYTKLSDSDIAAMYDYFMNSVQPVKQANRPNDIPALLSMRWPLAIWNWMFHEQGAYQTQQDKGAEWNRGAYLVQGSTHCGTCHTPRGVAMQTTANDETETGFLSGSELAGWHAFNISNDNANGLGDWSNEEIVQYLKTGSVAGKAQAAGPMAEAVENSFRFLTDDDLNAIAVYLRSVPGVSEGSTSRYAQGKASAQDLQLRGLPIETARNEMPGEYLYMANCSTCHDADGSGSPDGYYPSVYHNSVVGSEKSGNLIQVVLHGVKRHTNDGEVFMPALGQHLSDDQIATLVNFLTDTYGQGNAQVEPQDVAKLRATAE